MFPLLYDYQPIFGAKLFWFYNLDLNTNGGSPLVLLQLMALLLLRQALSITDAIEEDDDDDASTYFSVSRSFNFFQFTISI